MPGKYIGKIYVLICEMNKFDFNADRIMNAESATSNELDLYICRFKPGTDPRML